MENINSPTRKHHFNKGCDLFADLVISNCILRRLSLARPNQTTILKNLRPTVKHLTMHLTLCESLVFPETGDREVRGTGAGWCRDTERSRRANATHQVSMSPFDAFEAPSVVSGKPTSNATAMIEGPRDPFFRRPSFLSAPIPTHLLDPSAPPFHPLFRPIHYHLPYRNSAVGGPRLKFA